MTSTPESAPEPTLPDDPAFAEILQLSKRPSLSAVDRLRVLLDQAEQAQQPQHRLFAMAGLAICLHTRDPGASLALAREALPAMQAIGSRFGLGTLWTAMGAAYRQRGELNESLAALEAALDLERSMNHPAGQARSLANLSITLTRLGRRDAGVASLEEALALVPADDARLRVALQNNLSNALADGAGKDREEGRPPEAWRPKAARAATLARDILTLPEADLRVYLESPNYPRGSLAKALVVLDELDQALPMLQDLQAIYTTDGNTYALLFIQRELTQGLLQAGQAARARDVAKQAITVAKEQQFTNFLDELWLLLSRAHEALGEWEQALRAFQAHHRIKLHAAMQVADASARSLAVRLDTARAQRESRLDPLTRLLNRRGFDEAILAELAKASVAEPLALLLIDLDYFKAVNDTHGHAHGDQALVLVGQQLQRLGRSQDQSARLGGDEFAWFGILQAGQGLKVAERLLQSVRTESQARWPDQPPLTLSIGVAEGDRSSSVEELVQRADRALYAAKAAGRDCAWGG